MAFVIADRVKETTTTTGTGNITLAGAVTGFRAFSSVLSSSDTTYYTISDQGGANWEVGIATFTSPSTLARTTVLSSSNSGNAVDFTAGTKDVFISLPASKTNTNDQPNVISVNSSSNALHITQTGAGNALVVEDSANPDATPFVVNAAGTLLAGYTTPLALDGKIQAPVGGAALSAITTNAGSTSARSHWRLGVSDVEVGAIGTVGTSMTFLTNAITRMSITETGNTTITAVGTGGVNGTALSVVGTNLSGATTNIGISINPTFGLGATVRGIGVQSTMNTEAGGAGLATAAQFRAIQGTLSTAVTSQYGFWADSTLIGATNNYGFYSNIASGSGRWNFYANGTADNYFAGNVGIGTSSPGAKLDVNGAIKDSKGDVRTIVQNAQTSAYVLVVGDAGKHISITTGGVTVNSGIFSAGDAISIYNNSTSNQTITQGSSVTMYLGGTDTTGNRTLAQRGICTILCVASNTFVISGAGVT